MNFDALIAFHEGQEGEPMPYIPKPGGYRWRDEIARLIESEESELGTLDRLLAAARTTATAQLIAGLISAKTRRLAILNRLLHEYRETGD